MHSPSGRKSVEGPEDFARIFDVSRETLARLGCYAELLARWQRSTNLVAASTLRHVWSRHFADSAQILALAPEARLWLDLGTGAGFPGLVIALLAADNSGFRMHLVDSNAKKCAFLAEAARATKLSVDIHNERIEEFAQKAPRLIPDIVCARALAPLPRLFELAAPFFGERTRGLFLKGRAAEAELEGARSLWDFEGRLHQSITSEDSSIVEIMHLRRRERRTG
jgi:16S rRNA (guanine527-N7)-methyltransferase